MILHKYRPLNEHTINLVRDGSLWFSNLDALNDPFEGDYYLSDDTILAQAEEPAFLPGPDRLGRVARYLSEDRSHLRRQFYVLSLSKIHDDILMWSHYADQHNGVVVEIDFPDKPEHLNEIYHKGIVSADGSILQRVNYSGDPVAYDPSGHNEESYSKVITSKTKQWEYEKEYRVIIHDPNKRKNGVQQKINPSMIKKVFFGMRCSPRKIDETIVKIGSQEIEYHRMYMKHGHFSLISVEA